MVLDTARRIAEEVLFPAATAVDAADRLPDDHLRVAAAPQRGRRSRRQPVAQGVAAAPGARRPASRRGTGGTAAGTTVGAGRAGRRRVPHRRSGALGHRMGHGRRAAHGGPDRGRHGGMDAARRGIGAGAGPLREELAETRNVLDAATPQTMPEARAAASAFAMRAATAKADA